MQIENENIEALLSLLQDSMTNEAPLPPEFYDELNGHPEYGIELMQTVSKESMDELDQDLFMAYLHLVELSLVQLRLAREHHERWAEQHLGYYQEELIQLMETSPDPSGWLPLMNVFFEAGIQLDEEVKHTYLKHLETQYHSEEHKLKQEVMFKRLLADDSETPSYELAEMLFAQTSALPFEFFPAFVEELFSFDSEKAKNVAILFALHPEESVRDAVIQSLPQTLENVILPDAAMSRLIMLRHWVPERC